MDAQRHRMVRPPVIIAYAYVALVVLMAVVAYWHGVR